MFSDLFENLTWILLLILFHVVLVARDLQCALLMLICVYMSACHGVFADFAESFSSASAQRELFAPLSRYEQICRENVDLLQRVLSRSVPTHARLAPSVHFLVSVRFALLLILLTVLSLENFIMLFEVSKDVDLFCVIYQID